MARVAGGARRCLIADCIHNISWSEPRPRLRFPYGSVDFLVGADHEMSRQAAERERLRAAAQEERQRGQRLRTIERQVRRVRRCLLLVLAAVCGCAHHDLKFMYLYHSPGES
jgi:hypothetical protein